MLRAIPSAEAKSTSYETALIHPTSTVEQEAAPFVLELVLEHSVTHVAEEIYHTVVKSDSGDTKYKSWTVLKSTVNFLFKMKSCIKQVMANHRRMKKPNVEAIVVCPQNKWASTLQFQIGGCVK